MAKRKTINIVTLGCSKNLVDSENLMGKLENKQFDIRHNSEKSDNDIVIINTCGFINDAKEESIETILQHINAKELGKIEKVFVMGCLSQRYRDDLEKEMPQIDGFYGVASLNEIVSDITGDIYKEDNTERTITTPSHYAYLKVAEGCNRKCSFCAIPLIRGTYKSRTIESIVIEAKNLVSKDVKELLLIAQDLTYYGKDLYKKNMLAALLEELTIIKGLEWIRLHYTYPNNFPQDVIDIMKQKENICNYIDIPVQHISNNMLKSMKRGGSKEETITLIKNMREQIPEIALRTTILIGYPGETVQDFNELKDFVIESRFDRLGVFQYSHEENTSAFDLNDDVDEEIKQQRADEIMEIQQNISLEINENKVGKHFKVIFDRKESDYVIGRSEYDSPEVDNEIILEDKEGKIELGRFYYVKITKADFFDLYAEIVDSNRQSV